MNAASQSDSADPSVRRRCSPVKSEAIKRECCTDAWVCKGDHVDHASTSDQQASPSLRCVIMSAVHGTRCVAVPTRRLRVVRLLPTGAANPAMSIVSRIKKGALSQLRPSRRRAITVDLTTMRHGLCTIRVCLPRRARARRTESVPPFEPCFRPGRSTCGPHGPVALLSLPRVHDLIGLFGRVWLDRGEGVGAGANAGARRLDDTGGKSAAWKRIVWDGAGKELLRGVTRMRGRGWARRSC